jgi:hypothetical protein
VVTGKKGDDREAELEAALEAIKAATWKPEQTLPKLRRAIALLPKANRRMLGVPICVG